LESTTWQRGEVYRTFVQRNRTSAAWLAEDHRDANRLITIGHEPTAITACANGQDARPVGALGAVVSAATTLMNTAQSPMLCQAVANHPTEDRATGEAGRLGIGRFIGIAGSFGVAELARRPLGIERILLPVALSRGGGAAPGDQAHGQYQRAPQP